MTVMLVPRTEITIKNKDGETIRLEGCSEFSIRRSVEELSATGSVHLPTTVVFDSKQREIIAVREKVSPGNSITISAGYKDHGMEELFNGYIKGVDTGTKVVLDIEEEAYKLRKKPCSISYLESKNKGKPILLEELLAKMLEGTNLTVAKGCAPLKIDEFKAKKNIAAELASLKEKFGLTVYITKNKEVYAGLQANDKPSDEERKKSTINVTYGVNVVSNDVTHKTKDSNPIKVVVKEVRSDGKKPKEYSVGDDKDSDHTISIYNITDEKSLKLIADMKYKQLSYEGFSGTFTLFGLPLATAGGTVVYKNDNYKDNEGKYFIKGVETRLSSNGLRQVLTMGYKIEDENNKRAS